MRAVEAKTCVMGVAGNKFDLHADKNSYAHDRNVTVVLCGFKNFVFHYHDSFRD